MTEVPLLTRDNNRGPSIIKQVKEATGYRLLTPRRPELATALLEGTNQGPPQQYAVFTHGGAGSPTREVYDLRMRGTEYAAQVGERLIASGMLSPLDVAVEMVAMMENDVNLIAALGTGRNQENYYELDAFTMKPKRPGVATAVGPFKHPVHLARLVQDSKSSIRTGRGANSFGKRNHLPRYTEAEMDAGYYAGAESRAGIYTPGKTTSDTSDTVGAIVAAKWNDIWQIAIAGSTGGMPDKEAGRVGDCGAPGAGFFVDGFHNKDISYYFGSFKTIVAAALISGIGEASMPVLPTYRWVNKAFSRDLQHIGSLSDSGLMREIALTDINGQPGWGAMAGLVITEYFREYGSENQAAHLVISGTVPWFPVACYTNIPSMYKQTLPISTSEFNWNWRENSTTELVGSSLPPSGDIYIRS